MQRCRQHGAVADALEGEAVVAADGQTDGRIHRDGDTSVPAAGVAIHGIAVTHDAHREDPMLIETAEFAELDDRLVGHADDIAQVLLHIDEHDVAEVLAVALVHRAGGKIDAHEIIEYQGLR